MSWTELEPIAKTGKAQTAGVEITLQPTNPRRAFPSLLITFRQMPLGDLWSYIKPGSNVSVQLGCAEHKGYLRVTGLRTGKFQTFKPGGRHKNEVALVTLPAPQGLKCENRLRAACEFDCDANWISIKLPEWAFGSAAAPSKPTPPPLPAIPAAKPAKKAHFSMVGQGR